MLQMTQKRWIPLLGTFATLVMVCGSASAQDAVGYFRQNCASCHTIGGGRLSGPDLQGVAERQDRAWLARFLSNPQVVINSGDAYASQLVQDARGVIMPIPPNITPDMVEALLDLIEAESALPESQFVGLQISDRPLTPADIVRGRALFVGTARLSNDGPTCMSCHTVNGLGGLGGGRLAPDLSRVYERLQGRKSLSTWLSAPATPTMQSLYQSASLDPEEILPIVAFLEDAARRGGEDTSASALIFMLLGLGGAAGGLVAIDGIWKGRFRGVRRPLVHDQKG